jgi:2-oxoisovalerate dehydrogenase E1 component alpha subunit
MWTAIRLKHPARGHPAYGWERSEMGEQERQRRIEPADGGPDMVQLVTPEGERVSHPEYDAIADEVTTLELQGFYRDMVIVRRCDNEATALQRQGELGLWVPSLGQEAAQVGSGRAMRTQDFAFPTYREHGVAWCRGVDPLNLFHLYSFIIGTQSLHAVGYAMGMQRDGIVGNPDPADNGAVLVYFGDGATSQGDVSEALVFAASYQAPVVFFVQNNQWAISEPIERQSRIPLYRRATGFGIPSTARRRQRRARRPGRHRMGAGSRPTRRGPHLHRGVHLPDGRPHHLGRPHQVPRAAEEEVNGGPRIRSPGYAPTCCAHGAIDQAWLDALDAESEALGVRIREGCLELPNPVLEDYWDRVYAQTPPGLVAQREAYLAYEASFEGDQA